MRKNISLFTPIFYTLLLVSASLTLLSWFYSRELFFISAAIMIIAIVVVLVQISYAKKAVTRFLEYMGQSLTTIQKDALTKFPMPVFAIKENGEIVWYNNLAEKRVLGGNSMFGENVSRLMPDVRLTDLCPAEGYSVNYTNRMYTAYITPANDTDTGTKMYVVYFIDDTDLKKAAKEYMETRLSVAIIMIDNYEELLQSAKDNERSQIMTQVDSKIRDYVGEHKGLLKSISRDKYLAIIEERYMRNVLSNRFSVLDSVRGIEASDRMPATLSIGVGREAKTLDEAEQMARQALDMALGRGGDQAAVKTGTGYEFYGGVSKGIEKRTKVKTRIVATALKELIEGSDNVIIMGHRFADLDSFGAAVGLLKTIKMMGKPAVIAISKSKNLVVPLYERLQNNGYREDFMEPEAAMVLVTKKTLLIIVDTHIEHILESKELYHACKHIVVIDHHRKMVGHIDNAVIFYHEPYASSASEMVSELVQYLGDKNRISRLEAEALLAGIMLDTKNFVIRTGVRTFEAAAYLRRLGADTVEVRKLFASSMEAYQQRSRLVSSAEIYKNCAIATSTDKNDDMRIVAPQAADELLTISDVEASFVIYEDASGASLSARSMGALNVQLIMEAMGGGGHHTMAGAQLSGVSVEDARQRLLEAIGAYYDSKKK